MSHRDALVEKLKIDAAAGRLVTVTGTGLSVAATANQRVDGFSVATWIGLLQHGVKHCLAIGVVDQKVARLLDLQIESGEIDFLISAAETISQRMKTRSDGVFRGWLKDTVGKLEIGDRSPLDAVAAVPGVLATLNYDHLLEMATARPAVTWLQADNVQDVLTGLNREAVLHLHGSYKDPASVVLGLRSYSTAKDAPHARAVLNLFTIDRTLMFVGCGDTFRDPNFTRLIEWAGQALGDVAPRHYVLCRTSELEQFGRTLAAAPWLQPLDYGADYPELVPFLRQLVPAGSVAAAAPGRVAGPPLDLTAYQAAMRKRYSRLKLEELDPTTHDVRPPGLTGMFIAQSARECAEFMPRVFELPKEVQRRLRESGELEGTDLDEQTLDEHRRAYLDRSPRPILDIVRDPAFARLVVLGDPGSGKSTLLQYLLLDWAEKPLPDLTREPLPLLIELREYAVQRHHREVADFLDYLYTGAGVRWHLDREQLDAHLKANACLVLFDGLDEVFEPGLRREVSTAIHRFADNYPLARIIVSSRVVGFQHQSWRDEQFRHVMLQELDEPQIAEFLSRWHGHAYEDSAKGEAKRALLARAIEDSGAIKQLAGNPLLLTMMAILNRTQDLPRDRAELYEQCARLLLHQWKVDVAFGADPELAKASLDFKDKRGLLLRVARAMQSSERGLAGNLIAEDSLEDALAEGLKGVPHLRPDRAARALIDQLRGRNFMLGFVGGRSYAFVHRTFLEYFCAVEIRDRFQTEQSLTLESLKADVFGHWNDETWHEVLCLLAGMLDPRFVRECLEWLIAQPDRDQRHRNVLLAARCVGEVRKRGDLESVPTTVRRLTFDIAESSLGLARSEPALSAGAEIETSTRAVRLIAAVWSGEIETRDWLRAQTQGDDNWFVRQTAVQELARGWKDPQTLTIVKDRTVSDKSANVRYSAVLEVARVWKDDPETLPWLKTRAESDVDWAVRGGAVQALARGWKDALDTLAIVKTRAESDEDWFVRQAAASELAAGWNDDPQIFAFLKALALSDPDPTVRRTTIAGLAQGWRDVPETVPFLKDRALSDEDATVRRTALDELGRFWKDVPEVQEFVRAAERGGHDAKQTNRV